MTAGEAFLRDVELRLGLAAPAAPAPHPNGHSPTTSPRTIRSSEVRPEAVSWLWAGRVPFGMVTVVGGFPGVGKSTVLYDLAARASREGRAVLVVTAEDHLAAVVRPRLEAAEADLELVHLVTVPLTLPEGSGLLREMVAATGAEMVVLDPLVAFIGDGVNTHRDHHVRRVLAPLAELAEAAGAAVLVVIHTNKGADNEPLMRISGSIGFTGAARSVLLAADDPNDDGRRILAVVKSNLAEMPPPLAFRLAGVALEAGIETSRVEWLGEAPKVNIHSLLARRDPEERSEVEEAADFLHDEGLELSARPVKEIERNARAIGIHPKALQRARRRLGLPVWRDGFQGPVYWGLAPSNWTPIWTPQPLSSCPVCPDLRKRPFRPLIWTRWKGSGRRSSRTRGTPSTRGAAMRENAERKAERLLVSGRLTLDWLDASTVRATCRGDSGEVYRVAYAPDAGWTCDCPAFGRCSHILALMRVVLVPSPRRWEDAEPRGEGGSKLWNLPARPSAVDGEKNSGRARR
jgi:hypothetical protein